MAEETSTITAGFNSLEINYEHVVTIVVGKDETIFKIHEDLLTARSRYFETALGSAFGKEANNKVFELDDVDSDLFRIFVDWLYFGHIRVKIKPGATYKKRLLTEAWILGDRLAANKFCDKVMDELVATAQTTRLNACIYDSLIKDVYANTYPTSPLRRFFVNWFLLSEFTPMMDDSFKTDVYNERVKHQQNSSHPLPDYADLLRNPCDYHLHDEATCSFL